jgi:hypothetical protein
MSWKRCVLCQGTEGEMSGVYDLGTIVGKQYYHKKCIKDIAQEPEVYTPIQVALALNIIKKLKDKKEQALNDKKKYKENCKKIRAYADK